MEAALRTAYYCVEGVNPPADTFSDVRGFEGRKEAESFPWEEGAAHLYGKRTEKCQGFDRGSPRGNRPL